MTMTISELISVAPDAGQLAARGDARTTAKPA
jgi:hypothetical protein